MGVGEARWELLKALVRGCHEILEECRSAASGQSHGDIKSLRSFRLSLKLDSPCLSKGTEFSISNILMKGSSEIHQILPEFYYGVIYNFILNSNSDSFTCFA